MRCARPGERQKPSKRGRHSISGMLSIDALPLFPENRTRKKFAWFAMASPDDFSYAFLISSRSIRREENEQDVLFKETRRLLLATLSHALADRQYHPSPSGTGLLCSSIEH